MPSCVSSNADCRGVLKARLPDVPSRYWSGRSRRPSVPVLAVDRERAVDEKTQRSMRFGGRAERDLNPQREDQDPRPVRLLTAQAAVQRTPVMPMVKIRTEADESMVADSILSGRIGYCGAATTAGTGYTPMPWNEFE
jgi:hypothetical protein